MGSGPLDGILVVALEQAVAAPFCSSRLADAGARVIKIERPDGDFARDYDRAAAGTSSYFAWLNRGKESLVLDIKGPDDRALLDALVAKADVFIQNLAPGALERLGMGMGDLHAKHPRLITCDISSYGAEGPYSLRKGYDLLVQAETGLVSITGTPEGSGRVGVSVCDIATGMYAYQAVLEALLSRANTGVGEALQVSLFDSIADWMTVPLLQAESAGINPPRLGLRHPSIAPYGVYLCEGGEPLLISIQNEREWASFCASVLEQPALVDDPRFVSNTARVENAKALDEIIGALFARNSRQDMIARLDAAKIAYGAVNTVLEFADHPHLRRIPIETPDGLIMIPAPPAVRSASQGQLRAVPEIGQHNAAIRREFGF